MIFKILLIVNSVLWIILALVFITFLILRSVSFIRMNRWIVASSGVSTPVSRRYCKENFVDFYKRNKEKLEKHADEFSTEAPCLFSNFPLREDSAKERENKLEENDATEKKEYENVRIELSEDKQEQDEPSPESEVAE